MDIIAINFIVRKDPFRPGLAPRFDARLVLTIGDPEHPVTEEFLFEFPDILTASDRLGELLRKRQYSLPRTPAKKGKAPPLGRKKGGRS